MKLTRPEMARLGSILKGEINTLNGKIKIFTVIIVLAVIISCSSRIKYSNFQYLDVVEKRIDKTVTVGKDVKESVLLVVLELFEEEIVTERDKDWNNRIYYLPKYPFFELKQPESIFQKYLNENLERVDIMYPQINMEGSDYGSWRNFDLLRKNVHLLKEPENLVNGGDRRCEIEIGYAFTITPVYKSIQDMYFFVVQFGRRKYCMNSKRDVIDAYISVPGHTYPFIFFVCFNLEGDIWIKNYSF